MKNLWRAVPWLNRVLLLAPTALFTMLAVRIIVSPVQSAVDHGMSIDTPAGLTNFRSGNGGLFLALALFTLYCLVASRRHLVGLTLVATLMGIILVLRGVSAAVDATFPEQIRLLTAEAVFLTLSGIGIALELARQRHEAPGQERGARLADAGARAAAAGGGSSNRSLSWH
jgi:hypothetical protein